MAELPLEIWHEIGRHNAYAYNILARTCRKFTQQNMFELFITHHTVNNYLFCIQPNGWVYSIDGVCIDAYDVLVTRYGDCMMGEGIWSHDGASFVQYNIGPLWRQVWYNNCGQEHRDELPSSMIQKVEYEWKQNGLHHRNNNPAHICVGKFTKWFQYGSLHRNNAPAVVEYAKGHFIRKWFQHGRLHSDNDKPAIQINHGDTWEHHWYDKGVLHRELPNPAVLTSSGQCEYYYSGMKLEVESTKNELDDTMDENYQLCQEIL